MKTKWQTKKLGDICEIKPQKSEARKKIKATDFVSFVPMEDLGIFTKSFKTSRERMLKDVSGSYTYFADNDVLMAKITPCFENGKIGIAHDLKNGIGFGSSEFIVFRSRGEILSDYLYYILSSDDFRKQGIKLMSGAVGHKRIPKEYVDNFKIKLPPLSEQKRIIKILNEVFESVGRAEENTEKNLQNSKELFESYLHSVFANLGKDWEEKKLGEVCNFVRGPFGGSLKKSIFKKEGYVVYEQQHAIYNQFVNVRYFVDENKFNEMKRFELKSGDLIMSCSGTMGKIAIAPDGIKKGIINQALLKLSPHDGLHNEFLKYWMESGVFQDDLKMYTKGAAIKNVVSVKILKEIKLSTPKIEEQKSIVKKIKSFSTETENLEKIYEQKLVDLDELKKILLKKAFAGEL